MASGVPRHRDHRTDESGGGGIQPIHDAHSAFAQLADDLVLPDAGAGGERHVGSGQEYRRWPSDRLASAYSPEELTHGHVLARYNRPVDFARELEQITAFLASHDRPCAVIGGVALAAYGHPRMTLDLDLVTHADAQNAVMAFMESRGFATLHRSTGYSNHLHGGRERVDFMYVTGGTALRLFESVRRLPGPGGVMIAVPKPEHLIAMKVSAMKDAPERIWQDMADIGYLLRVDGVDRDEARGYFLRHQLEEKWHELERGL